MVTKRFQQEGIVVYAGIDANGHSLPKGIEAIRLEAGNQLPRIYVTNSDGSRGIMGIPASRLQLKRERENAVIELAQRMGTGG